MRSAMATTDVTTTILFTDLVNSTELLERVGDERAQRVLRSHHDLLRDAVDQSGGREVKWLGDGLMVAFGSAAAALRCAIAVQRQARRPAGGERLAVRVGLHVGEAMVDEADYFGAPVVIARRLCDRAAAGQIIVSELVAQLVAARREFSFTDLGELNLKGITAPVNARTLDYEHDAAALLARTPFVGRDRESESLRRLVDQALVGSGAVALVVGEPGIGKTRAAEETCVYARQRGAMVLTGRCYEGDWAPPFSPFVEAIRGVSEADATKLRSALGTSAAVLARIAPAIHDALGAVADPPSLQPDAERFRLLEAAANFFNALAREHVLVLVLDDLHWADRPTLAMLGHIARSSREQRFLIIGTYRDVEVASGHPLKEAVAALRRDATVERIALRGLTASDIAELVDIVAGSEASPAFIEMVRSETGSNPFFVRELLLHLFERRAISLGAQIPDSDLPIAPPQGLRDVIDRRVERLGAPVRNLLTLVSAMPGGAAWPVIEAASSASDADLIDAIDEAMAALLVEEVRFGVYNFTHALIRRTLYDALSTPRRLALHRRIGDAMESLLATGEVREAEVADQLLRAAKPTSGDARAVTAARRAAADARTRGSYEEAANIGERALAVLGDRLETTRLRCELLLELGEDRDAASDHAGARSAFADAHVAALVIGDAELRARAAYGEETARYAAGPIMIGHERDEVTSKLEGAIDSLGERDSDMLARLLARYAWSLPSSELDAKTALTTRAMEMARRLGDARTLMQVLYASMEALLQGPDTAPERVRWADELINAAEQVGEREQLALGHYARMHALLELGDIDAVDAELVTLGELARELQRPRYLSWVKMFTAMRAMFEGRWSDAEREGREALALERGEESPLALQLFGAQLFAIHRERGTLGAIRTVLEGFVESNRVERWDIALTDLLAELDERELAREHFERSIEQFARWDRTANFLMASSLAAEVCSYLGDAPRAEILYAALKPYARRNIIVGHAPVCAGSCERYLGLLARTARRVDQAKQHLEAAIAHNTAMGGTPWVAHSMHDLASTLMVRGLEVDRPRVASLIADATRIARELEMNALAVRLRGLERRASTVSWVPLARASS